MTISVRYIDVLHLSSNSSINHKAKQTVAHLLSISFYSLHTKWETMSTKFSKHCTTYLAVSHLMKSFDTWIAVLCTELGCLCLIAHQHSRHLLCLSLHNYTSWSCFLSPSDHLFPAANLLNVPATASTSSPCWLNLSIDIIFSLSTFLSVSVVVRFFSLSHVSYRRAAK